MAIYDRHRGNFDKKMWGKKMDMKWKIMLDIFNYDYHLMIEKRMLFWFRFAHRIA